MQLDLERTVLVRAPLAEAWALLRDVPRLGACIPKVSDLRELEPEKRYAAVVADRIGPFALSVPVTIQVTALESPRLAADLTGDDKRGQARVRGTLEAIAAETEGGTELQLRMQMEVLGKLATLGAVPIRRRADEIFSEFTQRVQAELRPTAA
jgi:uncharacterized protein